MPTERSQFKLACIVIASFLLFSKDVTAFGNRNTQSPSKSFISNLQKTTNICFGTFLVTSSCCVLPAFAGDIGKGQELFVTNCASCHLGGNNLASEKRTLKKDALENYGIGLDQPSIQNFVTNNARHKNLVFFRMEGGKLNPSQWEDVTTYISDQATGEKWQ